MNALGLVMIGRSCRDPEYYKWNQWLFYNYIKKDLHIKESTGNWCPSCKTTCKWGCKRWWMLEMWFRSWQKNINQWFFKIKKYSEDLLKGLEKIEWSNHLKTLQKNWIGKSEGVEIDFNLENGNKLNVYTTRPDTILVLLLVLAPEHHLSEGLVKENKKMNIIFS